MTEKFEAGRIAMRAEGHWWVAYFAASDTMTDAIEIGRVRMFMVEDPRGREAFLDAVKAMAGIAIEEVTGLSPDFEGRPAPEHERSGNA